jgi:hypothetical protein
MEDVVMQMECADAPCTPDTPIALHSCPDEIGSTLEDEVAENGDIWLPIAPPQQPIWPRVWPGL